LGQNKVPRDLAATRCGRRLTWSWDTSMNGRSGGGVGLRAPKSSGAQSSAGARGECVTVVTGGCETAGLWVLGVKVQGEECDVKMRVKNETSRTQ